MNKQRSLFFGYHMEVPHIFFTSDDQAFLPNDEQLAFAHAKNRGDNKVDKVTRAEYEVWKVSEEGKAATGGQAPVDLVKLNEELLEKANADLDAANKAKAELPSDATGPQKAASTKAVNEVTKRIENITLALAAAKEEAAKKK